MIEFIKDRWLTWRTGLTKTQRTWKQWGNENIMYHANHVNGMFVNFKHVFIINPGKFFDPTAPFGWAPSLDAKQYMWPRRALADSAVYVFARVSQRVNDNEWYFDELGGGDYLFIATNNSKDATMIALKYS